MKKCSFCDTPVKEGEKYCRNCGANLENQSEETSADVKVEETASSESAAPTPVKVSTQPATDEVVSIGKYIGLFLLMILPGINIIAIIIFACGTSKNKNITNFARALAIIEIVAILIGAIIGTALFFLAGDLIDYGISRINEGTDGMLSDFGIESFDDFKDFSTMTDEEIFERLDDTLDLSQYGINNIDDFKEAYNNGVLDEILDGNGYTEDEIDQLLDEAEAA